MSARADSRQVRSIFPFLLIILMIALSQPVPSFAQSDADVTVRLVHGVSDLGPLDIYVDNRLAMIGIVFGETSSALSFPSGDRQFAVVPSGAAPDAALVAGTITLRPDRAYYATLVGNAETPSVGLFAIDQRPLDQGRARFRFISGVEDASLVPAFSGGDALTAALGFGDASEYSLIDAGAYDLDFLDADSGAVFLSLPGLTLADGTTTDIVLVGHVADATLTGLVETFAVEVTAPVGNTAQIVAGTCQDRQALVADLGLVTTGQGEVVGVGDALPVSQGFGTAAVAFDTLLASPHAIVVSADSGATGTMVACGGVGGALTDTGSLVVALQGPEGMKGVAVLAPGFDDPSTTGVSVFVAGAVGAAAQATPAAAG